MNYQHTIIPRPSEKMTDDQRAEAVRSWLLQDTANHFVVNNAPFAWDTRAGQCLYRAKHGDKVIACAIGPYLADGSEGLADPSTSVCDIYGTLIEGKDQNSWAFSLVGEEFLGDLQNAHDTSAELDRILRLADIAADMHWLKDWIADLVLSDASENGNAEFMKACLNKLAEIHNCEAPDYS